MKIRKRTTLITQSTLDGQANELIAVTDRRIDDLCAQLNQKRKGDSNSDNLTEDGILNQLQITRGTLGARLLRNRLQRFGDEANGKNSEAARTLVPILKRLVENE